MAVPKGTRIGGRQKGTRNKRTDERLAAVDEAAARLLDAIPDAFAGDAHMLLMAVYKDPDKDWALRVDAAKAAVRYEKPALSSIEAKHSGAIDLRSKLLEMK